MKQVADTDLKEYLELGDSFPVTWDNLELYRNMKANLKAWPGCLIQAIDYLQEMRVKHRDLKPANLLIMGDQILIADFGVSKDLIDEETTASLTGAATGG
jgi:serine/threonine protein kinase